MLSGRWKRGEDWIRGSLKKNLKKLQSLKSKMIVFAGFMEDEIHIITADGVNYGTYEFRLDPDVKYYNHKGNGCGVKYEYALAVRRVSL